MAAAVVAACRVASRPVAMPRGAATRAAAVRRAVHPAASIAAGYSSEASAAGAGRDNEGVDRRARRPVVIIGSGPRYLPSP